MKCVRILKYMGEVTIPQKRAVPELDFLLRKYTIEYYSTDGKKYWFGDWLFEE